MRKTLKKAFCLLSLPIALAFSKTNDSFTYTNSFTPTVKRVGTTSPEISFWDSKYTIEVDGNETEYDITGSTDSIALTDIQKGSVISFQLYSKADKETFFDNSNNITPVYYELDESNTPTTTELATDPCGYVPEVSYVTGSEDERIQVMKYDFTVNSVSNNFALTLQYAGSDTYSTFEIPSFIFTFTKVEQSGISIYLDSDPSNKQVDGGSFDIVYTDTALTYQFYVYIDKDGKYSNGQGTYKLTDIVGDDTGTALLITQDGKLSVNGNKITAKLIFTKDGDDTYKDLTYTITLNILDKLAQPNAIFQSEGQSNFNNTIYNLIPGASYKISYTTSSGVQAYDTITALDGSNVLSTDKEVEPIYNDSNLCTNKGYFVADSNHSTSMSGATINSITRLTSASEKGEYQESDAQLVNFYVLPRVKDPQTYTADGTGINFDDSNGCLTGLDESSTYEITYYQSSDKTKLFTKVVQTTAGVTSYDLTTLLQHGSILSTIAKRGKSDTELENCLANSFPKAIDGTVYQHIDFRTVGIKYDTKGQSETLMTAITGLDSNTSYLLYTPSLSNASYVTVTSDSNGTISLMNNNFLGLATQKDTNSDLDLGGLKITSIKKVGSLAGTDLFDLTSNSSELILNMSFVSLADYKLMLVNDGISYVDKLASAALVQNGRKALNDKQVKAVDTCKANIYAISLDENDTVAIQKQIDELTAKLALDLNSYDGFMGYLAGIEGWIYICVALGLFLVLIYSIFLYRHEKKKFEKASVKIIERLAAFSPLSLVALYSFNSIGGNFFAPVIIIIEIVFIAIFLSFAIGYARRTADLKRWSRFHDDDGYLLEATMSRRQLKRMEKEERKLAEKSMKKKNKTDLEEVEKK